MISTIRLAVTVCKHTGHETAGIRRTRISINRNYSPVLGSHFVTTTTTTNVQVPNFIMWLPIHVFSKFRTWRPSKTVSYLSICNYELKQHWKGPAKVKISIYGNYKKVVLFSLPDICRFVGLSFVLMETKYLWERTHNQMVVISDCQTNS